METIKDFLQRCIDDGVTGFSYFSGRLAKVLRDSIEASGLYKDMISLDDEELAFYLFDGFTAYYYQGSMKLLDASEDSRDALCNCPASYQDMGFKSENEMLVAFGFEPEFEEVADGEPSYRIVPTP